MEQKEPSLLFQKNRPHCSVFGTKRTVPIVPFLEGRQMVREIVHDPVFLSMKCAEAGPKDVKIAEDLIETLRANLDRCVGMAANMIGERKRIIAIAKGPMIVAMMNPKIIGGFEEYEAEESCLSLEGTRKVKRYRSIRLKWQDMHMKDHIGLLDGFQAQIVQHEVDHCNGILV